MQILFLGTGAGQGVPVIGCHCRHCNVASTDSKSRRLRTSLIVRDGKTTILIDAGPDIRTQILEYNVREIDLILVTHEHPDHVLGLSEFYYWDKGLSSGTRLCAPVSLLRRLDHLYRRATDLGKLRLFPVAPHKPFREGPFSIIPLRVPHTATSYGYVFTSHGKRFVYLGDCAQVGNDWISKRERYLVESDCMVISTPFYAKKTLDHTSVKEGIKLGQRLKIKKTILCHISHYNKPHTELEEEVKGKAVIAYDGMGVGL